MLGLGLGVDKIRPVTAGGLLDLYPATAAYSLRALSSSTTNVVRVREDGTNTEQDFTAKEITDGTLATFCGANNGFVVTWYDQAGSNDATQATAGSQPKIYDSSTGVILENGKAAIQATDLTQKLVTSGISANPLFAFEVFTKGTGSNNTGVLGQWGVQNDWLVTANYFASPNNYGASSFDTSANRTNLQSGSLLSNGTQYLLHQEFSDKIYLYLNGVIDGTSAAITDVRNGGTLSLFSYSSAANLADTASKLQEVILYNTDQSANRTAIESNINSHYNIYS